jgi:hypothetical protein
VFAAVLSALLAGAVAPPSPKAPVPLMSIPRGEVPRDVSSAPKITSVPPVRPEG